MKKQLQITFLLTILMNMMGIEAFAHDIEVQNSDGVTIYYTYTNNSTELVVSFRGITSSSYNDEYSGKVVIPESVTYKDNTYTVTGVRDDAFKGCIGLRSVTIPNSVKSIGGSAFEGCSGLKSVSIPDSVTNIGGYAFYNCSGLKSVTIPNSVTNIENSAFEGCGGLTTVTISSSVTNIGSYAFYKCSSLTSVTIPNSVTSIGYDAFENTAWYNNQPDGVVYAGKCAYKYKGRMPANTSIILNEGTTGIADGAFSGCSGLTAFTIPNSVTSIGSSAFKYCSGLTSITIPNTVTSIGSDAFSSCI